MDNIILYQYKGKSIKEIIPTPLKSENDVGVLSYDKGKIKWIPKLQESKPDLIKDGKIIDTNIYYLNERVGLGRPPMYSYRFDIAVPKNTLTTALHIGDGKHGFSLGNGTNDGFVPEIIGVSSSEKDVGLYFIGRAGNDKSSSIPLVVIDGRNCYHKELKNRPIFGISAGVYGEYKVLINQEGDIIANDFISDDISIKELLTIVEKQQEQIVNLEKEIKELKNSL